MNYYAIDRLGRVLNDTMADYNHVNNGYDEVFGDYQFYMKEMISYMKEMIPSMIKDYMAPSTSSNVQGGPGNQFSCEGYGPTTTQRCPFWWRDLLGADTFTMTYKLVNSTGFHDTLQSMYGLNASWVTFGDRTVKSQPNSHCIGSRNRDDCIVVDCDYKYVNEPQPASNINLPSPEDTISKSLPALNTLQNTILARQLDLYYGIWNGSSADLIQSASMPSSWPAKQ
ncbi:hypothetical protein B0T24DRAFT_3141 [Lasiosphaeria ovina]|uniref:Uncharacterized protein n=1 Tax=Lasiosphaeria ovina TaxID=92902 RepID=A0AAE0NIM5_9PEZI|nr:hypothetical protein B0T24DRAFT_3141 [Lasiosphaeria ovina]